LFRQFWAARWRASEISTRNAAGTRRLTCLLNSHWPVPPDRGVFRFRPESGCGGRAEVVIIPRALPGYLIR
jgi:hypothetical protein